jgi:hypothetical protein
MTAMECPDGIALLLLKIIGIGLINVRGFAWQGGGAEPCAIEADHIHNLPGLLANFTQSRLRYYMDVYRPEYLRQVGSTGGAALFEPIWKSLDEYRARL